MFRFPLPCFIALFLLFCCFVDCLHIESNVRGRWRDPSDVGVTRLVNSLMDKFYHPDLRADPCVCPNIFAPNQFFGPQLPGAAIQAIEYAQCIFSCLLNLEVGTVTVLINNTINSQSEPGVLASASPNFQFFPFSNPPVIIPCSLNSVFGFPRCIRDLQVSFNPQSANYYFGIDGNPAPNQFDFVTIFLHELCHGFGLVSLTTAQGYETDLQPFVNLFDLFIRFDRQSGESVFPFITNPPSDSSIALEAVTSNRLFFDGDQFTNGKLFAPPTFSRGASIAHWDENTYPAGNVNSLFTPNFFNGEVIHIIGPLTCDVFESFAYPLRFRELCSTDVADIDALPSLSPSRTPSRSESRSASASPTPSLSRSPTPTLSRSPTTSASRSVSRLAFGVDSPSNTPTRSSSGVANSPSSSPSPLAFGVSPSNTPTRAIAGSSGTPTSAIAIASSSETPTSAPSNSLFIQTFPSPEAEPTDNIPVEESTFAIVDDNDALNRNSKAASIHQAFYSSFCFILFINILCLL